MYSPMRLVSLLLLSGLAVWPGCGRDVDADLQAHVRVVANVEGTEAFAAASYLTRFGRRALPTIEGAMHSASPSGRKNLIMALRKIGDPEAVPLLRHLAIYDAGPDVRREARWTLKEWAMGSDARAEKARAALRALDEVTGGQEAG